MLGWSHGGNSAHYWSLARLVASRDGSIGAAAFLAALRSAPPSRSRLGRRHESMR